VAVPALRAGDAYGTAALGLLCDAKGHVLNLATAADARCRSGTAMGQMLWGPGCGMQRLWKPNCLCKRIGWSAAAMQCLCAIIVADVKRFCYTIKTDEVFGHTAL
jgi:hypothetical protein